MKWPLIALLVVAAGLAVFAYRWFRHSTPMNTSAASFHEFSFDGIDGQPVAMSSFRGKTVLLVNVASRCGFTPQYKGLEELYQQYRERGFVVVGVPANDFMGQEPGTNSEIAEFCRRDYGVTFPMMAKTSVKGGGAHPAYQWLISQANPKVDVEWNFTKFLIGPNGEVLARFGPSVSPEDAALRAKIESSL